MCFFVCVCAALALQLRSKKKRPKRSEMLGRVYSGQRCLIKPYSQLVCPFKDAPGISGQVT